MGMNQEPVCKVDERGNRHWYINSKLHRTDGPAVIWADGSQQWRVNDQLHRIDGPAVIKADGTEWWYLNGKNITPAVKQWLKDRAISWPWPDEETKAEFLLTWL